MTFGTNWTASGWLEPQLRAETPIDPPDEDVPDLSELPDDVPEQPITEEPE